VQTAPGGYQSIKELVCPGGRLYETRRAVVDGVKAGKYFQTHTPEGAIYAFLRLRPGVLPQFTDRQFALDLLERKHVFVTPGHGFNVPYADAFRITLLPDAKTMAEVFSRINELCDEYARA